MEPLKYSRISTHYNSGLRQNHCALPCWFFKSNPIKKNQNNMNMKTGMFHNSVLSCLSLTNVLFQEALLQNNCLKERSWSWIGPVNLIKCQECLTQRRSFPKYSSFSWRFLVLLDVLSSWIVNIYTLIVNIGKVLSFEASINNGLWS